MTSFQLVTQNPKLDSYAGNLQKTCTVKHSRETPILLNLVNLSTTFCQQDCSQWNCLQNCTILKSVKGHNLQSQNEYGIILWEFDTRNPWLALTGRKYLDFSRSRLMKIVFIGRRIISINNQKVTIDSLGFCEKYVV